MLPLSVVELCESTNLWWELFRMWLGMCVRTINIAIGYYWLLLTLQSIDSYSLCLICYVSCWSGNNQIDHFMLKPLLFYHFVIANIVVQEIKREQRPMVLIWCYFADFQIYFETSKVQYYLLLFYYSLQTCSLYVLIDVSKHAEYMFYKPGVNNKTNCLYLNSKWYFLTSLLYALILSLPRVSTNASNMLLRVSISD